MPYGITQCYLPPGRGEIPAFTPAKLVLDLATQERCKAELILILNIILNRNLMIFCIVCYEIGELCNKVKISIQKAQTIPHGMRKLKLSYLELSMDPFMVWYGMVNGMVNVDLYSAIITKVSKALNTR